MHRGQAFVRFGLPGRRPRKPQRSQEPSSAEEPSAAPEAGKPQRLVVPIEPAEPRRSKSQDAQGRRQSPRILGPQDSLGQNAAARRASPGVLHLKDLREPGMQPSRKSAEFLHLKDLREPGVSRRASSEPAMRSPEDANQRRLLRSFRVKTRDFLSNVRAREEKLRLEEGRPDPLEELVQSWRRPLPAKGGYAAAEDSLGSWRGEEDGLDSVLRSLASRQRHMQGSQSQAGRVLPLLRSSQAPDRPREGRHNLGDSVLQLHVDLRALGLIEYMEEADGGVETLTRTVEDIASANVADPLPGRLRWGGQDYVAHGPFRNALLNLIKRHPGVLDSFLSPHHPVDERISSRLLAISPTAEESLGDLHRGAWDPHLLLLPEPSEPPGGLLPSAFCRLHERALHLAGCPAVRLPWERLLGGDGRGRSFGSGPTVAALLAFWRTGSWDWALRRALEGEQLQLVLAEVQRKDDG